MSEPFLGQIALFGFSFAPAKWATCMGQELPITQNTQLFSLIGTMFGGNGTTRFKLPDLQGRVAVGWGQVPGGGNYDIGDTDGAYDVTLNAAQTPVHSHPLMATTGDATSQSPAGNVLANPRKAGQRGAVLGKIYNTAAPNTDATAPMTPFGSAAPASHTNTQPYFVLNYCICLDGIFPSRS